jgi:hypothetical protein
MIVEQWKVNSDVSASIFNNVLLVVKAAREVGALFLSVDQGMADVRMGGLTSGHISAEIGIEQLLVDSICASVRGSKLRIDLAIVEGCGKCLLLMEGLGSSKGRGDTHPTSLRSRG